MEEMTSIGVMFMLILGHKNVSTLSFMFSDMQQVSEHVL